MSITIPTFPTVQAVLGGDARGTITLGGITHPIAAANVNLLRAGVISHASAAARDVNRPIELTATDPDGTLTRLAVHPDGYVQQMSEDRTVDEVEDGQPRPLMKAPCKKCGELMSVRVNFCEQCFTPQPLGVIITTPNGTGR